ncbi:transcriptional regulator, XRE family [Nitrobacter winogradskyi Nb-255]|uniref:Transcriptional regulator, XRE family n=2 Tax=Nitrobacter winogradskyi TaxID=913 RepID=Q3SR74_NITWN|nr:XRE family transcriptional regulator [Nitrobacter winogradskyi]ABA05217.1 transcriptional regulator, XRE family [Nitrobacter winogradskyi Nb-255]
MIDAAQLGDRLRAARERRGLSQQAVAEALGLPRTAVTNMESGTRSVSTLELTRLADLYGQQATFFLSMHEEAEDLSIVLHRALPEMAGSPHLDGEVRRILDLYQEGAGLRALLGRTVELSIPDYAAKLFSVGDAIRQGEDAALEERRRLDLGAAPIVNMAALISEQGIWTAATDLPDGMSGLFINHAAIGPSILVNAGHWPVRRRFSYAHEYAHALFDRVVTVTTTRRENASELVEKRANAFAAAFLMPPDGVADALRQLDKGQPSRLTQIIFDVAGNTGLEAEIRARPGSQAITYQDAATLARHFGVSYEAMVWRLKSLNHIGGPDTDALMARKDTARRAIRLLGFLDLLDEGDVPPPPEPELRSQLMRLSVEAYRQEEISRGRLLELARKLAIDGSELIELADATRAD